MYTTKDVIKQNKQQTTDWTNIFATHVTRKLFRIYKEI